MLWLMSVVVVVVLLMLVEGRGKMPDGNEEGIHAVPKPCIGQGKKKDMWAKECPCGN